MSNRHARHVGRKRHAFGIRDQRGSLCRGVEAAVDREDARALLREAERGRAAVADALAGALPGADHDRDLALEAHVFLPLPIT